MSAGFLVFVGSGSVSQSFGTAEERDGLVRLAVSNPSLLFVRGVPDGTSTGSLLFFQLFTYLAILAGLMSTFLAVRHSRAEEESGRAELISSTPAGRLTPTVATLVHGVLANLVLSLVIALAFIASGLDAGGSFAAGAATGTAGIVFLAVGLLASQLMLSSRAANGLSSAIVLGAWAVRGIGDALGTPSADGLTITSGWPSWLSPIGWSQQTRAFTADNYSPLLIGLGATAVLIAAVFALQQARDTGASVFAGRPGRATATASLSGPIGLAWRLQLGTIVGWCVGAAAAGFLAGSLGGLVQQAADSQPGLLAAIKSMAAAGTSVSQLFISVLFTMIGILAAACAVQAIMRMRQEESNGTAELLIAAPVSRRRWFVSYLVVGTIAILLVLACGAAASALSVRGAEDAGEGVRDSLLSGLAQLPAALLYLALLALVFAVFPRATIGVGWALLGLGGFFGLFAALVNLPDWMHDLSPFAHTPVLLGDDVDVSGGVWLLAIAVAAGAVGWWLIRRRDLVAG